jgi:hypothetical protein
MAPRTIKSRQPKSSPIAPLLDTSVSDPRKRKRIAEAFEPFARKLQSQLQRPKV